MGQIATMMLKNKGYGISDEAKDRILAITDHIRKEPNFANAREIRNIIEQVVMCQNVRCAGTGDKMIELAENLYREYRNIQQEIPSEDKITESKYTFNAELRDQLLFDGENYYLLRSLNSTDIDSLNKTKEEIWNSVVWF